MKVVGYDGPGSVPAAAKQFLARDPLRNTLLLTILQARLADSQLGRYWVAAQDGEVVGVGLRAPLDRPIVLSVMAQDVAGTLARAIAAEGVELRGVSGEAQVASRFAGEWAACRKVVARPLGARRLYEVRSVRDGAVADGVMELAGAGLEALAQDWHIAFLKEIGESTNEALDFVRRRIAGGLLWFWTNHGCKSIASVSPPVIGTARFQGVYTPPEYRRKGYAESLVRAVTRQLLGDGLRPLLFADLGDPVANGIYQRIGYEAAAEMILFQFGSPAHIQ